MRGPGGSTTADDASIPNAGGLRDWDTSADKLTETARSWLFVPGNRPDRFDKAASSGADMVILDLEDAVPADRIPAAREAVRDWLRGKGQACVRINAHGTQWFEDDVVLLAELPGLRAVMVPKAEDPAEFSHLHETLGPNVALIPLVETAIGLHRVDELAASAGVARLAFGSIDFALDIRAAEDASSLLLARSSLVLSSRVAGLPAPVDGVTAQLKDAEMVRRDAEHAVSMGFGGKLCIHPDQVHTVNDSFLPSEEQLRWAETVLEQAGDRGVSQVDGQMVDAPVLARARRVLDRAAYRPTDE